VLHGRGGFPLVLGVAAAFGAVVLLCALMFKAITSLAARDAIAPAE
jgi:hypothetical protein